MRTTQDAIRHLERISVYLEVKGENPFKINAFRKAASLLEAAEVDLMDIEDFTAMKGIGKGTATVLEEFRTTGTSTALTELEQQVPEGLIALLKIPGLGGKKLAKLHEVGVIDADSFAEKLADGTVEAMPGFGKKTVEKYSKALETFETRPERLPYGVMRKSVAELERTLAEMEHIIRFEVGGSFRRAEETCKDLDFILSTERPKEVKEQLLELEQIDEIIAAGDTKVSIVLKRDDAYIAVDFRLVDDLAFASTLHHFTGSKDHNVRMRQLAKERGESISEYGVETKEGLFQPKTEEELFARYDLPFIPPELRAGRLEFEADLNTLIQETDIHADVHMHTTWSDGTLSVEELVDACAARGYSWMAITDHSKYMKFVNGLTEERLRKQRIEIEAARKKHPDMTILCGVEMDILPDGSLDYEDTFLQEMDYVIASIHSKFDQTEEEIMQRLENACRNPYVSLIAHPTGRIIGRREGYAVNIDRLVELAAETGTALEMNANPARFDLTASSLVKAKAAGVKIMINTDTHKPEMLEDMKLGVLHARKAYLEPSDVINTWTAEEARAFFERKRQGVK
ncbi:MULTISPECIES: DNA polymerase/3'-5' exonuclease PolX [Exiguobacterium]|uniref:DNA polymerase beta n=1 Tax=Exiguobacterium antarcticum TaxID=132920 RepID=A0ABT6R3N7_9BACL|nr:MULTISPECIES: DNA polymerase/3'-5' exonuclease PolX [Exiguobacterium]AFS71122.1 PHP domain protein [Exiguobacterium antarcticum B7]MCT4778808.1 DNA polymerase/3'-5' exonuclease PolX [Exiguobacterium soli]MDI3235546.1 DNA polymerase/3'-5' exonuclease PolX [Exiguobacterium antarcticum]